MSSFYKPKVLTEYQVAYWKHLQKKREKQQEVRPQAMKPVLSQGDEQDVAAVASR